MDTAIVFRVTGKVQQVGFRAFVQNQGIRLQLSGWVKNNPDGSVIGVAEGEQGLLVEFIKQVKVGNRWSRVEGLEEQPQRYSGEYAGFEIRY